MFGPGTIDERFDTDDLDHTIWTPAYLPAWSSNEAARAAWSMNDRGLHLTIPLDHPVWCEGVHEPPIRVSAIQSGNWSGQVGSTQGQQPFQDGLLVSEAQEPSWGFTPQYGYVEVACQATLSPRSMVSAWMVGLELDPTQCGEICIMEIFGDALGEGDLSATTAVGSGIHRFRDPDLAEEFSAEPMPLDVSQVHRYAVEWQPGTVDFMIDGTRTKTVHQAPDYPMQLIIGVFDFPEHPEANRNSYVTPELVVKHVTSRRPTT